MSDSSHKKRYVSTCRIYLKPPTLPKSCSNGVQVLGNGLGADITALKSSVHDVSSRDHSLAPVCDPEAPHFTEPLEDCLVDEGCDITLQGVVAGSQPMSISWLHNGEPVRFGEPSFDGRVARLVVRECLPEDAGAYTCVAENEAGKTSSSAAVCVRDFETVYEMHNKLMLSPPLLNCNVENKSSNGQNTSAHQDLRIPDCQQTSIPIQRKGLTARRRTGSGKEPPVRFEDPPEQLEVPVGETARLHCAFRSSFPVATCWLLNKKQVADCPRTRVECTEKESVLVISEAQPSDAGRYTIVARDRRGFAQHTITLTVIDRPQPPTSCPVVSLLSPSSLVLTWSGPCYDGGSAVTAYVVEARREGPGRPGAWSKLTGRCRSTSYQVSEGLEPRGEYRFRVRACNAVGISKPSQESDIVKMDAVGKPQEETKVYEDVTIDTTHSVKDHYEVKDRLGAGKFGQVFKLIHKETGRVCAGKFYKVRRSKEKEAARKEIELMNCLHHPKLVQCLGAYDNSSELVMVLEFIAGGELFERIVDDNFEHTETSSVHYMQQILEGIQYMHKQSIVHLDLKPENIVCVNKTSTLIKIIDFGLASKLDPNTPLKVMHGTPEFVAPEVINFEPVGLATDMWSIGVICYILLSGVSPFQGESDAETLALVTSGQWDFEEESFTEITDQAKDFISALLRKDTRLRLSCTTALAHPWVTAFNSADPRTTKTLSKDKMKKYLAKQKWKKAGKALLALKRMALLSNKSEAPDSPRSPGDDSSQSPETEKALQSLEEKLLSKPQFHPPLRNLARPRGSTARLFCQIQGYPDPEVEWLRDNEPLEESARVHIEYEEDGRCTLVLSQVVPEDSGWYTCKAFNSQGEAQCSAKFTVQR
ncbi:hypothetical protein MATL_G00213430 [Megalops atlanticus]|uniref:Myosin light chain kinase, smooth muscle-like n=1 Tax=Megalops atlanticus TaxID=7932 RepID=A0A9D3PJY1_MEGAT|nr:hypothetical protein MATL_G00213430 [Megalops atlanticus]